MEGRLDLATLTGSAGLDHSTGDFATATQMTARVSHKVNRGPGTWSPLFIRDLPQSYRHLWTI